MKLTPEEVLHIAQLARLHLSPEEVDLFSRQLNDILGYMEQLNALDTEGVEPTFHALHLINAFRGDLVQPSFSQEEALAIAPEQARSAFVVPKVI
ncbi:MAG: Asp-tRNA(Asn)/Glu-tRNA(Gln) amidotransferase subunit GatC [Deltaproteobacteria bacterium]|nr:Asp-tRNA(Asn)/Glu-tRNA(Gln) amidotransferase subunit GatC [Deltaproteobacteria bacterium]